MIPTRVAEETGPPDAAPEPSIEEDTDEAEGPTGSAEPPRELSMVRASVGLEASPAPIAPAASTASAPCPTPVTIERVGDGSHDRVSLVLVDCEGRVDAASQTELSILARPSRVDRPTDAVVAEHAGDADWVAPRVRRLHPGLLERLRVIADRFPGRAIEIVSGYRPDARDGSRHRFGRALDLRVVGVELDELDAFVRSIDATGCGLYPTTDFVHLDVRRRSAHWIDTSGPGEAPALVREPAAEPDVPSEPPSTTGEPATDEDDAGEGVAA